MPKSKETKPSEPQNGPPAKDNDQLPEEDAKKRFDETLARLLGTPPTHQKSVKKPAP